MILLKWLDDQLVGGSMSDVYQSLAHSKWDCKYHVVFVPKRRRKAIFGNIRRQLVPVFHALAKQKECQICRRALDAGPRAHVHRDSAEASGSVGDRFFERKQRNCHRAAFRKGEELSLANASGLAATRCPRWGSNWSKCANTSAS